MFRQLLKSVLRGNKPQQPATLDQPPDSAAPHQRGPSAEGDSTGRIRDLVVRARHQRQQGSHQAARALLEQALAAEPTSAPAHHEMALACLEEQNLLDAHDHIRLAAHLAVNDASIFATLGTVEYLHGRLNEAIQAYQHSLDLTHEQPDVLTDLAIILLKRRQFEAAADAFARAVGLAPAAARPRIGLAQALLELGRYSEALSHINAALAAEPLSIPGLTAQGQILSAIGHLEEGLRCYSRVLGQEPTNWACRWNTALNLLLMGDFQRGWPAYEVRWESQDARRRTFRFPEWTGEPLPHGVLLIYGEQGLGDELMFASCIEEATSRCGRIILECDSRLVELFAGSFPQISVIGRDDPRGDCTIPASAGITHQVALGSLPGLFRKCISDFPARQSYLKADPQRQAFWQQRLAHDIGRNKRVGLSWRGGGDATRRNLRSVELASLAALLDVGNVGFVSLQYGRGVEAELSALDGRLRPRLRHYPQAIADYAETAALVASLDLVISVQTAVVHLAGALGRPVWVMVPFSAEWRYGHQGTQMPWYPTAHLYRQKEPLSWTPVITQISDDLRTWVAGDLRAALS